MNKTQKEIENLKTEIVSLKIRVRRLESFIQSIPSPDEYLDPYDPETASEDDLVDKAIEIVSQYDAASASLLQRRLAIGYARAARLMDILENKKVVAPSDGGAYPRKVLVNKRKSK